MSIKLSAKQALGIKFPIELRDSEDRLIMHQKSKDYWFINNYDRLGYRIGWRDSAGRVKSWVYDDWGNRVGYQCSSGYWYLKVYNKRGVCISKRTSKDKPANLPVEMTLADICKALGKDIKVIK